MPALQRTGQCLLPERHTIQAFQEETRRQGAARPQEAQGLRQAAYRAQGDDLRVKPCRTASVATGYLPDDKLQEGNQCKPVEPHAWSYSQDGMVPGPSNPQYFVQMSKKTSDIDSQAKRFKDKARELGCDESEERFNDTLKQVAKHQKPGKPLRNR